MKTAIIVHGMPSKEQYLDPLRPAASQGHWLPWIQRQLTLKGVAAQLPEMPEPYAPDYENWREVFEQFKIDEDTMLVGHSCGGGFLVKWLSENKIKVGKVALVAPWLDPTKQWAPKMFSGLQGADPDFVARTKGVCLFISLDDDQDELDTAEYLKKTVKDLRVQQFTDRGHFLTHQMGTNEFPELRDFLLT
jgi:predicted alpha/beta hydrolase family esterase